MSVRSWFVKTWTNAKGAIALFFEGPGGLVIRQALGTVIDQAGAIGVSMLLDVAKQRVTMLNPSSMTNDAKRIQALDFLKGYALKQGIQTSDSLLRYVLETAVRAVKGA